MTLDLSGQVCTRGLSLQSLVINRKERGSRDRG